MKNKNIFETEPEEQGRYIEPPATARILSAKKGINTYTDQPAVKLRIGKS